jgi:DNA-binding NarL/FixJ family response regulator
MASSRLPSRVSGGADHQTSPTIGPVSCQPAGPIRVLVVDDDSRVRAALCQTIAIEADLLMVADAATALAALDLAEHANPSVALVDVLLPDDSIGLSLVHNLAQRQDCAVIALSVQSGLRLDALAAGAVDFVEKGGDIDALLRAIRCAGAPQPSHPDPVSGTPTRVTPATAASGANEIG